MKWMAVGLGIACVTLAGMAGSGWCAATAAEALPTLSGAGKTEAWVAATAQVRELLPQLDGSSPLVRRWLPAIRVRCEALQKLDQLTRNDQVLYTDVLAGMLEDLVAGKQPFVRYGGRTLGYGYWSDHVQRIEGHKLFVPPGYDPGKEYQLFVYYKMGGGGISKWADLEPPWRPEAEMCAKAPDTFHVWSNLSTQVKGRMGAEVELRELSAALTADFSISPDRVFLSGFSDGGFTALWLGSHYPQLVAGIAPEVANWQYTNIESVGLLNVPMLVVDGWWDGGYVESNLARFYTLSSMGHPDISAMIGRHDHDTVPFEDERHFLRIMEWARERRRDLWPKRVRYATWNLLWHQAYWFSIERMVNPSLVARVEAQVKDGNTIEVSAKNVAAYALSLSEKLVDPARPVRVITNGKASYTGRFRPEVRVELQPAPKSRHVKVPTSEGDLLAQTDADSYHERMAVPARPWLWVRPTGGREEERQALGPFIPSWAVDDVTVTEEQLRTHSLYLFGGPGLNRLADRMAGDAPVQFGRGKIRVGGRTYDRPEEWVKFIQPNPFEASHSVIVYGFNDAAAAAKQGFHGAAGTMGNEAGWEFRAGDCVVYGVSPPVHRFGITIPARAEADYYIFGANWEGPDSAVLGHAEQAFDYLQVEQLKAEAIKEATGADAGLIWGLPPSYLLWRPYLPAGALTLNDIAMVQSLPEYVQLCEVSGAQLKELARGALCSTVVTSRDDSLYDPQVSLVVCDIQDDGTYTLATDYFTSSSTNALTYSCDPQRMPEPFAFVHSMEEFAAYPSASVGSRNLRLADVEVTEAMAQYLERRGRISPRPVAGKLDRYLANPEDNFDSAYDWHHLRLPASFGDPKTGVVLSRDVFLNIGLRASDEAVSPTDRRTKAFASPGAQEVGELRFDWRGLRRRLPVTMTSSERAVDLGSGVTGRVVTLRYENLGEAAIQGLAALSSPSLRAEFDGIWPYEGMAGAPKEPYCQGLVDTLTADDKPYNQQGVLVVFGGGAPQTDRIMLANAGWNTGVIGFSWEISIPPHGALDLPVLFVSVSAPDLNAPTLPDLGQLLEKARPALAGGSGV